MVKKKEGLGMSNSEQAFEQLKFLREQILRFGDAVIISSKGLGKTTLLKWLIRTFREQPENRCIVFETFPKLIHELDKMPYMVIEDSDVVATNEYPYVQKGDSYLIWNTNYFLVNEEQVKDFLDKNKDVIFLIEVQDLDRIAWFMASVIYYFYRKRYLTAKRYGLEKIKENTIFFCEESYAMLDRAVISKTLFNRLRKWHGEMRNLKCHMVCVGLRMQSLNAEIRAKMGLILSRCSLDDFDLKINRILRKSKYRNKILDFQIGDFLYTTTDFKFHVQPFIQKGIPYLWQPTIKPKPQQKEISLLDAIKHLLHIKRIPEPITRTMKATEKPITETEQKETCESCGCLLTKTRAETDANLCQQCQDDRATEEEFEEF